MCESTVLLRSGDGIATVMSDAIMVRVDRGSIRCMDITGREVTVDRAKVAEIDLLRHRIMLDGE